MVQMANVTKAAVESLLETWTTLGATTYYINIALITLIILFNGILIVAYMLMPKPNNKKTPNICLFNQSFGDLSVSASLVLRLLTYHIEAKLWCYEYPVILYTMYVRIGLLMINVLDRFIALKVPSVHWRLVTKYRVVFATVVVWLVSVIPALKCSITIEDTGYFGSNFLWDYTIIETFIIFLLGHIVLIVLLSRSSILNLSNLEEANDIPLQILNEQHEEILVVGSIRKQRMLKASFIMVFLHAVTLLPYLIASVTMLYQPRKFGNVYFITYYVYASSAAINPMLTIFLNKDFRCALKRGGTPGMTTVTSL